MKVRFYDAVDDSLLKFAVIAARSRGKWVFCRHRERDTWEIPGGHREPGEAILDTAKRELREETGALDFELEPLCVYSVTGRNPVNPAGQETFGLLCAAEITSFEEVLHSEMAEVRLMDTLPGHWTYPLIQPELVKEARRRKF